MFPNLRARFGALGLAYPPKRVFLRAYKHERVLEVWAADDPDDAMVLVEIHRFCAASGSLGPKREEGDQQVPEGVYVIDFFNAASAFHLSMRVSYPNLSDCIRGVRGNLGGDIMIHGGCASIGCIASGDAAIERVFILAYDSHRLTRVRPVVHLFPTRFTQEGWEHLQPYAAMDPARLKLWRELEAIDRHFEEHRRVPQVVIDEATGAYRCHGGKIHASQGTGGD